MTELGRSALVWVLALVACVFGTVPAATMGLTVPGQVSLPLAMGLGALVATLVAGWAGNLLFARDGSHTRLLAVLGMTEAAAMVVACIVLLVFLLGGPFALLGLLFVGAGVIALSATVATRRLRRPADGLLLDLGISVGLLILGPVALFGLTEALCSTVVSCMP